MRGRRQYKGLVAFVQCVLLSLVATAAAVVNARPALADTFNDPGFSTEVVNTVDPYTLVGLAFAPDGRMFVWQKNGIVRVVKNGVLLPTPFIDVSSRVNSRDDRGFWGFAFDPDFATNGYVYMTYTYEDTADPNSIDPKTSRLTRATANPANPDVALPGSEIVILGSVAIPPCSAYPATADCIPADGGSHTIGSLQFGSDGKLLVGIGDGADANITDPLALRSQDLNSINGKIIRINKDGTAPADNPFYDGTNSVRSKVWLYGVRNPFRFSVQPQTGDIWFGEVGWNTWEEVNRGVRGGNYGWPCYEAAVQLVGYMNSPACSNLAPGALIAPYHSYNHTVGTAAIGGPFYNATAYPAQYRGNFFFADYSGNFIKRVTFDAAHNPTGVVTFATNVEAPVALEVGPDGLIYYLSFTTGEIRRIRANGPIASAAATPAYGMSPLTVDFSSAGSSNPGGGALTYLWDFGDGTTSAAANPSHVYTVASATTYAVKLTVRNSSNVPASATVNVTAGSTPPVPTISAPIDGTIVQPGANVNFLGTATDAQDGTLTGGALSWTVLLHHNTHIHTFVAGTGNGGSFVAENHGPIGTFSYEIILTAQDSSGLKTSTSVSLPVGNDAVAPTAPSGLTATAVGAGQMNLAWTASTDNVAVAGYRLERCNGSGCSTFAQVATPGDVGFTDTGLTAQTSYSYRVRAVDPSGNLSGYSNVATASTGADNRPPGLVAGYTFDAGSGSTASDISGNGNNGTILAGTWTTTGKYGGALSFNGTNDRVQVPNSTSLALGSGMTLAAWIQPTAAQGDWRTIMQKEVDAYFLNASNETGALRPSGGATVGGAGRWITGTTANPVGAWTHVAATYDGTTLRLYVNGVQVAQQAATGAIQATNGPLWIGGNSPYGEYFRGIIDEAQVYNRALTPAEIATIRDSPLEPPVADPAPPSIPAGLTATATSSSQINLAWTASTDNVAVSGYQVERCTGAACSSFVQVASPTGVTVSDTGLAGSTSYSYRVRALDTSGNLSGYSAVATASTPAVPDTTAPTAPSGLTATASGTTHVDLTWIASTDNVAVTGYRVERCEGAACSNFAEVATPTGATLSNAGLSPGTTYRYRVRAADAAGNLSAYSGIATATTPSTPDTTAPSIPAGLTATAAGSSQVNLSWTASTDNVGVTGYRVERCTGAGCSSFAEVGTPAGTTFSDTGLSPSTTYGYRVRAVDAAGNLSGYSATASATTAASGGGLPSGMVAGWSFNAGSGMTAADISGNGNTGTVQGATWSTAGKYGNALSFNGSGNRIQVPNSTSLALGSGMTLAAWINPAANQGGWRTIMQKETDAYFLNASNETGALRPSCGGTFGGAGTWITGTTANPVGTWTHVAATYDGTTLRLYVNGTQVAQQAASGALQSTNSPLWIGGNNPYGEYFVGLIDEAQIYNRALTPAELQTVMNTPLS